MKQKWWSPKTLLLAGLVMFGSFYIALVVHPVAFADYAPTNGKCEDGSDAVTSTKPGTTEKQQTCGDSTKKSSGDQSAGQSKSSVDNSNSTCAIEKMGWIICPLIETVGKIGDRAFGFLADNFLRTEPELVSNSNYGTKAAWEMARSIANIVFIIALLVIIYSQVTGAGINNYGIKKMLPRLIVAAIAVNLSYYICQGMVDLSNILGYEIKAFLVNTSKAISTYAAMPPAGSILGSTDSPGALQTIIGYGLGVASLAWFLLPLMFMSAGSIVIICVVIIIILLLRKAFIVLLVVVSPVAFVLYLLPNTERYFRKWASMLWQLLMVFPVVALLFGSGQLASAIILASGAGAQSNQNSAYYSGKDAKCIQLPQYTTDGTGNVTGTASGAAIKDCGSNSTSLMLGLIAAGIAVAPLFAVISVLKGALAAAGAIGGKISGAVEKGVGNGVNGIGSRTERMRNRAKTAALTGTPMGRVINAATLGQARRGIRRDARRQAAKEDLDTVQEAISRGARNGVNVSPAQVADILATRRRVAQQKFDSENMAAAHHEVDLLDTGSGASGGDAGTAARALIARGEFDSPRLAALLEHLAQSNHTAFMAIASSIGGRGSNLATQTASRAMSSAGIYGGADAARMARGEVMNLEREAVQNVATNGVSSATLAGASNNTLAALSSAINGAYGRGSANPVFATAGNAAAINVGTANAGMSDAQRDNLNQQKARTIASMS